MRESVREHHVAPVHFSQSSVHQDRHHTFSMSSMDVSLPSVTLENESARKRRQRPQRTKLGCAIRLIVLGTGLTGLYRQSSRISNFTPQTIVAAPSIRRDYSSVKSVYDLSSSMVKPWCFRGVRECPCTDPLVPIQGEDKRWATVFQQNLRMIQSHQSKEADVVFLGDSITERWRGTEFGEELLGYSEMDHIFKSFFSKRQGTYDGMALGIAGDRTPNLLWRIQNGELGGSMSPKVYVVLIGTNDLGYTWCSPELVVVGILRVVEELLLRKKESTILLHGLLPRSFHKEGYVGRSGQLKPSVWGDIQAINAELKMYATYRDRVYYYDTDVFLMDPQAPTVDLKINKELMPDFLHPSSEGYKLWGQSIVKALQGIIPDEEVLLPKKDSSPRRPWSFPGTR